MKTVKFFYKREILGGPGNKRFINCFLCLPGKIKPSNCCAQPSAARRAALCIFGLHFPGKTEKTVSKPLMSTNANFKIFSSNISSVY